MIITDKAQIKIIELRESNNLRLSGSDELECYELIESDLKLPADATFTRSSIAYLSDGTQVDVNMPRLEQGRFGKAIMVEEGTTNGIQNGNFATGDFTGWTGWGTGGYRSIVNYNGVNYARIEHPANATAYNYGIQSTKNISVVSGDKVTVSFVLKGDKPNYAYIMCSSGGNIPISPSYITLPSGNLLGTYTWTSDRTANVGFMFAYHGTASYIGEFTFAQIEKKPYATSFINGTRSPETLTIPTAGVLKDNEGTIELWAKKNDFQVIRSRKILDAESPRIDWQWSAGGYYFVDFGGASFGIPDPAKDAEWHFYAITYSGRIVNLYFDGVKVGTGTATVDLVSFSDLTLGSRFNGTNQADALFDDLRISSIARSDEEILAAYQSGQPLAADEWTTYKLDFDDKVRITTQGQIICNELIEI